MNDNTPTDDPKDIELVLIFNLVGDYEDVHYPIGKPSLIEVLKLRMYEMGLTQAALAKKNWCQPITHLRLYVRQSGTYSTGWPKNVH